MNEKELRATLETWKAKEIKGADKESWQSKGSTYLRERLRCIAHICCHDYPGDLVEIGCLNGGTTIHLAQVAYLYNRRVICVDPWEVGTQNCEGLEYDNFLKTTEKYKDILDVVRLDSRSVEAIEYLKNRQLCFAFVDGLHEYDAVLSDVKACYHSPLICCDDIGWSRDVELAYRTGAGERTMVDFPYLHEGYIL